MIESERSITTKSLARQNCNRNSEHLAQRRKGAKVAKEKTIPDLACLASWRELIPMFRSG